MRAGRARRPSDRCRTRGGVIRMPAAAGGPLSEVLMAELQQVGLRHPAAELVRDIQRNRTGIPRRAFVAEGLFENNIVLEAGVAVDTFLWCPEAAYSDEASTRSKQLPARAHPAYPISAKKPRYLAGRPPPDGPISGARPPENHPRT